MINCRWGGILDHLDVLYENDRIQSHSSSYQGQVTTGRRGVWSCTDSLTAHTWRKLGAKCLDSHSVRCALSRTFFTYETARLHALQPQHASLTLGFYLKSLTRASLQEAHPRGRLPKPRSSEHPVRLQQNLARTDRPSFWALTALLAPS